MNRTRNLITCGILSTLLCGACAFSVSVAQSQTIPTPPAAATKSWKFHNEQEWIVDSIGRDIAEMLVYAKYHGDSKVQLTADAIQFKTTCLDKTTNKYKFEFIDPDTKSNLDYEFTLKDYVWSSQNYVPFAEKIISALGLKADDSTTAPSDYLKNLSNASMSALLQENDRISKALSATPLDASLHEQAALLQGTFDLIEFAGAHSDTRPPLNRMAAHISIAEALDKTSNFLSSCKNRGNRAAKHVLSRRSSDQRERHAS
ncbi:MAG TPA: hypothetical protein V6C76_06685 [Drouetiella sp.]